MIVASPADRASAPEPTVFAAWAVPDLGELRLGVATDGSLRTWWDDAPPRDVVPPETLDPTCRDTVGEALRRAADALSGYFGGTSWSFHGIPTPSGPDFHARCWEACRGVPAGETCTYAALAVAAGGRRVAARAAGQAMRRNPLPVIVPCHRVVGGDGRLHGYAGSTRVADRPLRRKRWLLAREAAGICS
mgnify:CR=1 FL=1